MVGQCDPEHLGIENLNNGEKKTHAKNGCGSFIKGHDISMLLHYFSRGDANFKCSGCLHMMQISNVVAASTCA